MSNPKVLQVTPVLQSGGAEHVAAYLAHSFAARGRIALVSVVGGPYAKYLLSRQIRYKVLLPTLEDLPFAGTTLVAVRSALGTLKRQFVPATISADKQVAPQKDLLEKLCPDYRQRFAGFLQKSGSTVVHFHGLACAGLFQTAKESGRAVVYGHHNTLSERHGCDDISFLNSQLQWVDLFVFPSSHSRSDFLKVTDLDPERAVVIANPSFLATGTPNTPSSLFRVGTASNLGPAKGIDVLLRAWALLRQRGYCIPLEIAGGDRATVSYWRRGAKELQIDESVRFLGNIADEAGMQRFYADLKVVVIPSRSECFPLLMLEAMSRGIPVVASNLPIFQEVLGDQGLLFPSEDAAALANCIETVKLNPELAASLGEKGLSLWKERYSPEEIIRRYASTYETALLVADERSLAVRNRLR